MNSDEERDLHSECWKVIIRVNAIIAGLEKNKQRRQQPNIDELLGALVLVNQSLVNLGAHFGVSI